MTQHNEEDKPGLAEAQKVEWDFTKYIARCLDVGETIQLNPWMRRYAAAIAAEAAGGGDN